MKEVIRFEISWQTLWKIFGFCLLVVILYMGKEALGAFFTAVVISLGIDPFISFLQKRGISRLIGTLMVFAIIFLVIVFGIYFFIPIITIEASEFLNKIHDIFYSLFGIGLPENLVDALTFSRDKIFDFISNSEISVSQALSNIFTTSVYIIGTILISFYLAVEKDGTERLLRVLLPEAYEAQILKIFQRFKIKIRKWFIAQLGLSLLVGVIVAVGLWLLGVKYSLILGIIAAILELVPVIGPILVGSLAFLVAITDSFVLALYAVIFFFVVQQLENHVFIPLIIGKTMKVHPIVVLIALLAGGEMAGILGIILAVPLAVLAQEIFNHLSDMKDRRPVLGI